MQQPFDNLFGFLLLSFCFHLLHASRCAVYMGDVFSAYAEPIQLGCNIFTGLFRNLKPAVRHGLTLVGSGRLDKVINDSL